MLNQMPVRKPTKSIPSILMNETSLSLARNAAAL